MKRFLLLSLLFLFLSEIASAQTTRIFGKVVDQNNTPLFGINIAVEDKTIGTITDADGVYRLETGLEPPYTVRYSSVGFESKFFEVTKYGDYEMDMELPEATLFGNEVVVSASRYEESILSTAASIEKIDIIGIQQAAAANFYDELYKIKGVDMIVQSLTFRNPNSRGFNDNTNYRLNQFIDGVDNASPGLSFSAGNIFGLSPIDIESVELLVGASSALYGPGGMNGTLLMTSKSPFEYTGLSASVQASLMHVGADYIDGPKPMHDVSVRYAQSFNDRFAFKVTGSLLQAEDWHANDFRDKNDLSDPDANRWSNSGFNGVNVYGDETAVNLGLFKDQVAQGFVESQGLVPGTPEYVEQFNFIRNAVPNDDVTRTGWEERDLVNYNTQNARIGLGLHYKINDDVEAIVQSNYGLGTAVYSAQNRFSLNDFSIVNYKAEVKGSNFFARAWGVNEQSGESYDAGGLAAQMNEGWKPSEAWFEDYIGGFLNGKLGFGLSDQDAHNLARTNADNFDQFGNTPFPNQPSLPQPGSERYNHIKDSITALNIADGGARILDKSAMYQVEGMYDFRNQIKSFGLMVGAQYRLNVVNSEGSIYFDEPGDPITMYTFGAYAQLSDEWVNKRLKPTLSFRYDKHEYFEGQVTPRFSFSYAIDNTREKFIRGSAQTAFRFPSVTDQWVNLMVGPITVVGGHPEVQDTYNFSSNPVYPLSGSDPIFSDPDLSEGAFTVPEFAPEKVTAFELGYKGLYLDRRLMFDGYVYYNTYNGFIASQNLVQNPNDLENERRFQTTISIDDPVNAYGWAAGVDYKFPKNYFMGANVSYNDIESDAVNRPGFQVRFNTPEYRYNINFGNRRLTDRFGFNVNYRWQQSFIWESSFGVGEIPAFGNLDAQVSFKLPSINSMVKLGASNILNDYYTTSFGSSSVGGMYYVTFSFDEMMRN